MKIEKMRIWHWCILGILAGLGLGTAKLSAGAPEPEGNLPVTLQVFEDHVIGGVDPDHRRVIGIRNVRIHPSGDFVLAGSKTATAHPYISYEVLLQRRDNPKLADVLPRQTLPELERPKKHAITYGRGREREVLADNLKKLNDSIEPEHLTLAQYLDKLNDLIKKLEKSSFPEAAPVSYKYNWWETPRATYSIYSIGGFVAIGLIFPSLIQLLVVAGYGRQKSDSDEYDLDRFHGGTEPAAAKKAIPLNADQQLAQLEAELEAKLKSGASDRPATPATPVAPAKPVVAKLTAGKLEAAKNEIKPKAAPKGYGAGQGDYYPTEVHGKKP